jgi:hypothetical protein
MIWVILLGYILPAVICAYFFINEFRKEYNAGKGLTLEEITVAIGCVIIPVVSIAVICMWISTLYDEHAKKVIFKKKD